ncbi:ATP synthase subunit d, mitochondrial [Geodia barretti]|uniref:ATP synthase subunit d, mitochondrial n=1 Tax=Geodia barretti TaxID=519541 RepID=A0AA35TSZ7_GEOBA|nr:ATP synthase subunit d, mitochondrial [Geodia barretti]
MSAGGRKAGQLVVDWARMAGRISEEGRARFSQLRGRYEACKTSLNSYPEKPQPINWDHYRQNIAIPGLVESFQKQYGGLSVPHPKDTTSASIDKREREVEVIVQETLAKSKEKMKEWQEELAALKAQKPFEDMTIQEYLEDKPELKKLGDEMTRKQEWGVLKE